MAPLVILIFLVVAVAGAAVWFFVLRAQLSDRGTATPPVGSAGPTAVATGGSGSAHTTAPTQPPTPTGAAATGAPPPAGSAAPAETPAVKADLVETEITTSVDGASVEISGTDQKGPAPFTARLEKGKPYKARIMARGFATTEIDILGGAAPKQNFKLVPKPRLLKLSSDPAGAQILIDGISTGKTTPSDIELTPAQAAKKSIRVVLRKPGFRGIERVIDFAKYVDGDTQMTARLDEKLTTPPPPPRPPAGGRPPPSQGSDTGSGPGSDSAAAPSGGTPAAPAGGSSDGSTATPPATPPAAPSGAGATGGSAEPEPEFNKPK